MKKIELQDPKRTGVFPEHAQAKFIGGPHEKVRLTVPAREALEAVGASITPEPLDKEIGMPTYTVEMYYRVPAGLVAVATEVKPMTGYGCLHVTSLRMETEPPYPAEIEADYWTRLDFTPCPKCGAPLIWYEAGYVPGYRVCAGKQHHHWLAR